MLNPENFKHIIAEAYHKAALTQVGMIDATKALEAIRSGITEGKNLFELWDAIDDQIGLAETEYLQPILFELRNQFETQVHKAEVARLYELFAQDSEVGWVNWLDTYVEALTFWRIPFCFALSKESFSFPARVTRFVKEINVYGKFLLHERWLEAYNLFDFLFNQNSLSAIPRAKLYVLAGYLQLYHFRKPKKAKELFERAKKLAPKETKVLCAFGDYWLSEDGDTGKTEEYFQRAIKTSPQLQDGYIGIGDIYEKQKNLDAAEKWYQKAIRAESGSSIGYTRLIHLYGRPEWFREREGKILSLVERIIAVAPDGEYSTYLDIGNIYQQNNQYKQAHEWYQRAIDLDNTQLNGYISRGNAYIQEENYEQAYTKFEKGLEIAPEAFDAYQGMARLHKLQQQWEKALYWYKESLPRRLEWEGFIRREIGEMEQQLKRYSEAEEELFKALYCESNDNDDDEMILSTLHELAKNYYVENENIDSAIRIYSKIREFKGELYEADYQNFIGNLKYHYGEYDAAADAYCRAIAAESNDSVYHHNLAGVYLKLGNLNEAETSACKAVELEPNDADYQNRLGTVYSRKGEYEKAIDCFKKAIEKAPKFAIYYANLGIIFSTLKRWEETEESYRMAIKFEPENSRYHYNLAEVYLELENLTEAERTSHKAIEIEPNNPDYQSRLGLVYFRKGEYEKALNCCREAIKNAPDIALYYANIGNTFIELKRWQEAEEAYHKAIELEPKNADYQNRLGNIYYWNSDYKSAIPWYKEAITNAPKDAIFFANLGNTYSALELWQEAEMAYDEAIQIDPNNSRFLDNMGDIYYQNKEYKKALEFYKNAIEFSPKIALYHADFGSALRRLKRWNESEEAFQKAIELEPENASYHLRLGNMFYEKGDHQSATKGYSQGIELLSKDQNFSIDLSNSCEQLDNVDKAIFILEIAIKNHPDKFELNQALERLKAKKKSRP